MHHRAAFVLPGGFFLTQNIVFPFYTNCLTPEKMTEKRITLILALFVGILTSVHSQQLPSRWWEKTTGNYRMGFKANKYTIRDGINRIDSLYEVGFRCIEVYAPHEGSDVFSGLAVKNFYNVDPQIGTLNDLKEIIAKCHAKGMAVITFINLGYCSTEAPFFLKACEDIKKGIQSKEASWFLWNDTNTLKLPNGNQYFRQEGYWVFNKTSGKYYFSKWKSQPQFNFASKAWQEECRNIIKYYLDLGFDGFILDAVNFYINCDWQINNYCITDLIHSYPNKFIQPEGAGGFGDDPTGWITQGKYTCVQDYRMNNWWEKWGLFAGCIEISSPYVIDIRLQEYRDKVVKAGGVTYLYPYWEKTMWTAKRLLELAGIITSGHFFTLEAGSSGSRSLEMLSWKPTEKEQFKKLLNLANSNPALYPAAARIKVPTNDDTRYYSYLRTSTDGKQRILVVLNFQSESTITLDLKELKNARKIVSLVNPGKEYPIQHSSLSVKMPWVSYDIFEVQ